MVTAGMEKGRKNIFHPFLQYFEPHLDFGGNFHTLMRYSLWGRSS